MRSIKLSGTPEQRGLVHGESFKKEIHELATIRTQLLRNYTSDLPAWKIEAYALENIKKLSEYPDLYQEFCGIAEAADISLVSLYILNDYTDLRDFSFLENPKEEGCSVFWVKNSRNTVAGQTWDMHESATPYILHMEILENEKTHTHVLSLTGCLGLAGINRNKVMVMINNMHCTQTAHGLMWGGLVRSVLNQGSAKNGYEFLQKNLPCSGHNYMIADPEEVYNVETTGQQSDLCFYGHGNGHYFHTNHYVGKLSEFENSNRQSKSTHKRFEALEGYFNKEDPRSFDRSKLTQDLLVGKVAETICLPHPGKAHASMTCGGLIFDLKKGEGEAFAGLYTDKDHLSLAF